MGVPEFHPVMENKFLREWRARRVNTLLWLKDSARVHSRRHPLNFIFLNYFLQYLLLSSFCKAHLLNSDNESMTNVFDNRLGQNTHRQTIST